MGRHGIIIDFAVFPIGERYNATYLPSVAVDQGQCYKLSV